MAYELVNKVVLITGAASGIGESVVRLLLQEQVEYVAILDIAEDTGVALEYELNETYDGKVKFILCDVTNEEQLFGAFQSVVDAKGRIDVVINNAGIMNDSLETYKKEIDINITALVTGTLKALKMMRTDEGGPGGTVINIASAAGLCQLPQMPVYWATKAAVIQFSNCIGLDEFYSKTGVRVLTVCFGATDTSLITPEKLETLDKPFTNEFLNSFESQKKESAAACVVSAYKLGASGSTWLAVNDEPPLDISNTVKAAYGLMAAHVFPDTNKS